jgi:hypothetical protein
VTADELQGREISDAASRIDELQQRLSLLERRRDHGGNGNAPEQALPTFGPTFGGSWRYDAPLVDGTSATQVRQILMRIDELTAGRIQGRYTSSAQGFDGAPASVFVFEFAGTITGRQGAFPWTATGGATGEIQLRLLGRNVLDARWWPDGVGESSIGTSGGAVFHRDLIP